MISPKEKYKPFRRWNADEIEEIFGLRQVPQSESLQTLLAANAEVSLVEQERLGGLSKKLAENVEHWNEEELKLKFIAQLLELVDYDTNGCKTFADRIIAAEVNGKILSGTVDVLIARGNRLPKSPLLCIHEYKKERGSSDDPLGQLLAAMIVAERINTGSGKNAKPVFGAYTIGRLWFFVALEASSYAVSREFNAANTTEILALYRTLKFFKQMIPSLLS